MLRLGKISSVSSADPNRRQRRQSCDIIEHAQHRGHLFLPAARAELANIVTIKRID
jgi:hypothetical protein